VERNKLVGSTTVRHTSLYGKICKRCKTSAGSKRMAMWFFCSGAFSVYSLYQNVYDVKNRSVHELSSFKNLPLCSDALPSTTFETRLATKFVGSGHSATALLLQLHRLMHTLTRHWLCYTFWWTLWTCSKLVTSKNKRVWPQNSSYIATVHRHCCCRYATLCSDLHLNFHYICIESVKNARWSMSPQEAGDELESMSEFQVQIKEH